MSEEVIALGLAGLGAAVIMLTRGKPSQPLVEPKLYFHIKQDYDYGWPTTKGHVAEIYQEIVDANSTKYNVGLQPHIVASNWQDSLDYYVECADFPLMVTALASDGAQQLTLEQLDDIFGVCGDNVKYIRIHEAIAYFDPNNPYWGKPFPSLYVAELLDYVKKKNIPVFWSEWDIYSYFNDIGRYQVSLEQLIEGYENNVAVSFGTNGTHPKDGGGYYEPVEIFDSYLQMFQRKAASIQSWYWWQRNGQIDGYELTMPPYLMAEHTEQAFKAGCEVIQYEPYNYFFNNITPKPSLSQMLHGISELESL